MRAQLINTHLHERRLAGTMPIYCAQGPDVSTSVEHPLVLLVEDDRDGRLMYAEWLQQAGFRVEQAHNGLQALERAFDVLPAAVVTDLNIPGIDGYELTRRLKADERTTRIPIIAVTGYAPFTQDPSRADRAGCDAIIPKPCLPEDLESTIRSLLANDRHTRSA